jgi:hypothetical protein
VEVSLKLRHSAAFRWNVRPTSATERFTSNVSTLPELLFLTASRKSLAVMGISTHPVSRAANPIAVDIRILIAGILGYSTRAQEA